MNQMGCWTVGTGGGVLIVGFLFNLLFVVILAQQEGLSNGPQTLNFPTSSDSILSSGTGAQSAPSTIDELHPTPQNLRFTNWLAKISHEHHYPQEGRDESGFGPEEDQNSLHSGPKTTMGFLRSLRRLGSEFLGKRMLPDGTNPMDDSTSYFHSNLNKRRFDDGGWGKKRRLGSEFLGKRSKFLNDEEEEDENDLNSRPNLNDEKIKRALGSEFLGKRGVHLMSPYYDGQGVDWAALVSPHWDRAHYLHSQLMQQKRRLIGSEFLGK